MISGQKVGCVVVAAGRGARSGLDFNKVFYKLDGVSILNRSMNALSESGIIDEIALVLNKDDIPFYEKLVLEEGKPSIKTILASGGATRQESVFSGLCALDKDTDIVLIHDAARPYVSREIIVACAEDACSFGSGVISTPVIDTIKKIDADGFAVDTPPRDSLRAVQTPQAFRFSEIIEAHRYAAENGFTGTDDAALYERKFKKVKLTYAKGAEENRKFTTPSDFEKNSKHPPYLFRTGTGYDVHRLVEGRKLILCGVEIPYEKGLLGHSDADVALHALMDAMLGACAMGDIGKLFPDTDNAFKGISSMLLLEKTNEKIREKGFSVTSADITIVCQRPKLSPYIEMMRMNIAEALSLPVDRISVKATTTEKLGFEGEGLGISAQAVSNILDTRG